jgi:peptidoglycan LD-endopeptidase CwlK
MSRDIEELVTELREKFADFCMAMDRAGIRFIVTSARRTQAEQDALYAQGRTLPGKKVTWTRRSKHIEGKAFDIAILNNGKVTWELEDYLKAGEIGESVGLIWGGSWQRKDYPHFEI